MSDQDELRKMGKKASRQVAAGRAARRQQSAPSAYRPRFLGKGDRLPDDWILDPINMVRNGGYRRYMRDCEDRELDEARRRIAAERPHWRRHFMRMVEAHLEHETDPQVIHFLKCELRTVRRALGLIKPSAETVKEQTRERVRRHRERARKAAKRAKKRPTSS